MNVFEAYARYYDLLYRDKDYLREAHFIACTLRRARPEAASVLDLGCGTGRHAGHLAQIGFDVTGVDSSSQMLEAALRLRATLPPEAAGRLRFAEGDARNFRAGTTYDAVTALFHVLSYQTDNDSVRRFFTTAAEHLAPGGVFLFDCWYGPAVLTERPAPRSKTMSDEETLVRRRATPNLRSDQNIVDVRFDVEVTDRSTQDAQLIVETHAMRYFFSPELEWYLSDVGFDIVWSGEFATDHPLDQHVWNAAFLTRKRPSSRT